MPRIQPPPMRLSERVNAKLYGPTKITYPKPEKSSLKLPPGTSFLDAVPLGGSNKVCTGHVSRFA